MTIVSDWPWIVTGTLTRNAADRSPTKGKGVDVTDIAPAVDPAGREPRIWDRSDCSTCCRQAGARGSRNGANVAAARAVVGNTRIESSIEGRPPGPLTSGASASGGLYAIRAPPTSRQ